MCVAPFDTLISKLNSENGLLQTMMQVAAALIFYVPKVFSFAF
jgi:hypothetical protein